MSAARPLLEQFPLLAKALPHVALAELPTPVEKAEEFGEAVDVASVYVKRDDMSAVRYGGNKVRKLEFLLADAVKQGACEVMTFGCAGSNHATATAIYARQMGLNPISMLLPQPNAHSVRRNLLMSYKSGAEIHMYRSSGGVAAGVIAQQMLHRIKTGRKPYVIPAGGSSALGAVGYVNAAFELRDQIAEGLLPEPARVYVAAGTAGTAAGLILGFRAMRMKTQVIPVRVTGETFVNVQRFLALLKEMNALLRDADPSFPLCDFAESDILLRHDCYGEQYALYTKESVEAVRLMRETQSIPLEGTYTGKACAALIDDARNGLLKGKPVLFWNTYNSRDFTNEIAGVDYHDLPRACHEYFEHDVQPLDRR